MEYFNESRRKFFFLPQKLKIMLFANIHASAPSFTLTVSARKKIYGGILNSD
jgi:hypothetical protein